MGMLSDYLNRDKSSGSSSSSNSDDPGAPGSDSPYGDKPLKKAVKKGGKKLLSKLIGK